MSCQFCGNRVVDSAGMGFSRPTRPTQYTEYDLIRHNNTVIELNEERQALLKILRNEIRNLYTDEGRYIYNFNSLSVEMKNTMQGTNIFQPLDGEYSEESTQLITDTSILRKYKAFLQGRISLMRNALAPFFKKGILIGY